MTRRRLALAAVLFAVALAAIIWARRPLRELEAILRVNEATRKSLPSFTADFESTDELYFESDNQSSFTKITGHITWSQNSRLVEGTREIDREDVGDSLREVVPGTRVQESIKFKYMVTEDFIVTWDEKKQDSVEIWDRRELDDFSSTPTADFSDVGRTIVDRLYGGPGLTSARDYILRVVKGIDGTLRIDREGDRVAAVIVAKAEGETQNEIVFEFLPSAGNALFGTSAGPAGSPANRWDVTFERVGTTMLPNSSEWKVVNATSGRASRHRKMRCTNMRIIDAPNFSITDFTIPIFLTPRFYFYETGARERLRVDVQPDGTLKFRPVPIQIGPYKFLPPFSLGWYFQRHWHHALIAVVLLLVAGFATRLLLSKNREETGRG